MAENKENIKVEDVVKAFKNFQKPGEAVSFLANRYEMKPMEFLAKKFLRILGYGIKNGITKTIDIGKSVKDFSNKNVEDNTNIDYDNLEIDDSTVKMQSLFGKKDDKKKLFDFIEKFKEQMKDVPKEIEKKEKEITDEAEKKGVDVTPEEVKEHGIIINSEIKKDSNKDIEGKELKKKIDDTIKERDAFEEKSEKLNKELDEMFKDPDNKKMKQLDKKIKEKSEEKKKTSKKKDEEKDSETKDSKEKTTDKKDIEKEEIKNKKTNTKDDEDKKNKKDEKSKKDKKEKSVNKDKKDKKDKKEKSVNKDEKKKNKDDKSITKIDSKIRSSLVTELADSKNKDRGLLVQKMTMGELKNFMTPEEQQKLANIKAEKKDDVITVMLKAPRKLHWLKGEDKTNEAEGWKFTTFKPNNTKRKDIKDFVKMAVSTIKSEVKDVDKIFKYRRTFIGRHKIGKTKKSGVKYDSMILIATLKNNINESSNNLITENKWISRGVFSFDYKNMELELRTIANIFGKTLDPEKAADAFKDYVNEHFDDISPARLEKMCDFIEMGKLPHLPGKIVAELENMTDAELEEFTIDGTIPHDLENTIDNTAKSIVNDKFDDSMISSDKISFKAKVVNDIADDIKNEKGEVKDFVQSDIQTKVVGKMTSVEISDSFKELDVNKKDVLKILADGKSVSALNIANRRLAILMDGFKVRYDKDPELAVKTLLRSERSPEAKDVLAEIACKINPDAKKYFEDAGIKINGSIDGLTDTVKKVAGSSKGVSMDIDDKNANFDREAALNNTDVGQAFKRRMAAEASLRASKLGDEYENLEKFAKEVKDCKDPAELEGISSKFQMLRSNISYQIGEWHETGDKDSGSFWQSWTFDSKKAPLEHTILYQKMMDLQQEINAKVDSIGFSDEYYVSGTMYDPSTNEYSYELKKHSDNFINDNVPDDSKPKKRGGLFNGALGWAIVAAKTTGFVLNHSKGVVDALGRQVVKFKEDKNVIAQINCTFENGAKSDSKFSDTKFSVRFDVGDMKWHATNLDDRKMKIDEQKIIDKLMQNEKVKKFKDNCIEKWEQIFKPEGKDSIVSYIINSPELQKELKIDSNYTKILRKMIENFDDIKKQFQN